MSSFKTNFILAVPPLENGDRLTITEFERRYTAMPQVKKAELIEGMVHMASPLRAKEYLVWRVYDTALDWFRLRAGEYIQLEANINGVICSEVFPGLWLAKAALLQGDLATVLATLQQGIEFLVST